MKMNYRLPLIAGIYLTVMASFSSWALNTRGVTAGTFSACLKGLQQLCAEDHAIGNTTLYA